MAPCFSFAIKGPRDASPNPAKRPGKGNCGLNNIQLQEANKKAAKSKFHGHLTLKCRTVPRYPDTAEREFKRITNAYIKMLNAELKERLQPVMNEYKRERRGDSRFDGLRDLERAVIEMFHDVAASLEQTFAKYGLREKIEAIAKMTKNNSLREWKRAVHDTLGIDLLSDYYSASFYEEYLRRWIDQNVIKIKSIPNMTLDNMRQIIMDGYLQGRSIRDIQKDIQEEYNVTKHQAQMLARDQVATLNSQIAQAQQRDAGVTKYRWSTSHDSRVRDCHADLDGKVFSWDDPPEMWYETKSKGIVYTGRHCHPGEDYCCRCVAIPVFEFDKLSVPMSGEAE